MELDDTPDRMSPNDWASWVLTGDPFHNIPGNAPDWFLQMHSRIADAIRHDRVDLMDRLRRGERKAKARRRSP